MKRYSTQFGRTLMVTTAASLILSGCSISGMVDKMVTPEEKALAIGVAQGVCTDSLAQYRGQMTEEFRAHFEAGDVARLKRYCSDGPTTSKVVAAQTQASTANGFSTRGKQLTVTTKGNTRWTSSVIVLRANGDEPLRINGINMSSKAANASEDFAESWDNALPYIRLGAALFVVLLIGVIIAIVRYNRRLRERRGQP